MMDFMCETVQESSQTFSTDKQLEEGGIARGNELLVLESSVQDAARCRHQQSVSEGILVSCGWARLPISSGATH